MMCRLRVTIPAIRLGCDSRRRAHRAGPARPRARVSPSPHRRALPAAHNWQPAACRDPDWSLGQHAALFALPACLQCSCRPRFVPPALPWLDGATGPTVDPTTAPNSVDEAMLAYGAMAHQQCGVAGVALCVCCWALGRALAVHPAAMHSRHPTALHKAGGHAPTPPFAPMLAGPCLSPVPPARAPIWATTLSRA